MGGGGLLLKPPFVLFRNCKILTSTVQILYIPHLVSLASEWGSFDFKDLQDVKYLADVQIKK